MKKKVVLLVLVSLLFGGIVSAAGLYGTFEGYQIVRVQSNGQTLTVEDVPAVNLNGRTMVPIYMLRQLGADVTWDGNAETVNVTMPKPQLIINRDIDNIKNISDFITAAKNNLSQYGIYLSRYTATIDEQGIYFLAVYDVDGLSSNQISNNVAIISALPTALQENIDETLVQTRVNGQITGTIIIKVSDAKNYVNKLIDLNQFISLWNIQVITSNQTQNPSNNQVYEAQKIAACKAIEDKYEYQKRSAQESLGAAGLGRSSRLTERLNAIDEQKNAELQQYGCI